MSKNNIEEETTLPCGLKVLTPYAETQLSKEYLVFERELLMKLVTGEAVLPDPLPIYEITKMYPQPTQEDMNTYPSEEEIRKNAVNALISLMNDDRCYLSSHETASLGLYHVNIAVAHRLGDRVLISDVRSDECFLILDVRNTDWINGEN